MTPLETYERLVKLRSCADDQWKEPPVAHYSESGERFGTPLEMMAEIRRLRLALALAQSRVTPWLDLLDPWQEPLPTGLAAMYAEDTPTIIRLGDGTPEEQP